MPLPFFASVRPRARKWRRERRNRLRARALMRLIDNRLPAEYAVTGDHDAWPLIETALLSRTTTTLRTMMALQGRPQGVDAATLGRSLYEHVVHLAWLAADPNAARIEEWRKHDLTNRLKADADARTCGEELLDNAARAAMQAQVAAMEGNNLVLVNIAIAADQHWADRLPGMGTHQQRSSFKGLYTFLYRNYSGTAHPSYRGLNPVVEDVTVSRKRVVFEGLYEGRGPFGMATTVYGLGLLVAAQSLGWPPTTEIIEAFDRYPVSQ